MVRIEERSRAVRRLMVGLGVVALALTACGSSGPVSEAAPRTMTVAIVGDSYTDGTPIGGLRNKNWTVIMGKMLRRDGYDVDMVVEPGSGSGYVSTGWRELTFGDMARMSVPRDADVVLFYGSINDPAIGIAQASIEAASAETFAWVRKHTDDATLIVVGPSGTNEDVSADVEATSRTLRRTARQADATFVDTIAEKWFFGKDSALIGADAVHPTDDGHRYMAERLLPHVEAALDERIEADDPG